MNQTCFIYIRVSTEDQAKGFSPSSQRKACVEYAKAHGYRIVDIYTEDGKSAKTTDRPEFQKMMARLRKEPVGAIIFYKIDRFARNVADFTNIRKELKNYGS